MSKDFSQFNKLTYAQVRICRAKGCQNLRFGEKATVLSQCALQQLEKLCQEVFGGPCLLQKLNNGRTVCDKGFVSISHSGNFVAVAASHRPVGVDLQRFSGAKIFDVAKKVFTPAEMAQLDAAADKTDCFYSIWCKKEALWKKLPLQPPTVAAVDTTTEQFTTKKLTLDGETFYLAATGNCNVEIE